MLSDPSSSTLPAPSSPQRDEVLTLVRRLVVTAVVAGLAYSVFSTASQAYCPGGFGADGGFLDHLGRSTDVAPSCVSLTLHPSPAVYGVLAAIVVWAVTSATRADDDAAALRVLGWAGPTVIAVAVVALVATHVAFDSIPLVETWHGTDAPPPIPSWLAVDVVISPARDG